MKDLLGKIEQVVARLLFISSNSPNNIDTDDALSPATKSLSALYKKLDRRERERKERLALERERSLDDREIEEWAIDFSYI